MGNLNTTTIDVKTAELLYKQILVMEIILKDLQRKVVKLLPAKYGSGLWWEKSTRKAIEEIENGQGMEFKTAEEALKWLNT